MNTKLDWTDQARCANAGIDTNLFFSASAAHLRQAQEICAECPVKKQCLDLAMSTEPSYARHGVFGGLNPTQRRQLGNRIG